MNDEIKEIVNRPFDLDMFESAEKMAVEIESRFEQLRRYDPLVNSVLNQRDYINLHRVELPPVTPVQTYLTLAWYLLKAKMKIEERVLEQHQRSIVVPKGGIDGNPQ